MRSVLLVDDAADVRPDLRDRLVEEGYRVLLAADAEEALARAGAERFDLVVLDAARRVRSGPDACRELRQRGFDGSVILFTNSRGLDRAWGRDAMPTPRTVDVHVAWLRHKLEADPRRPTLIRTVRGVGYLFSGGSA